MTVAARHVLLMTSVLIILIMYKLVQYKTSVKTGTKQNLNLKQDIHRGSRNKKSKWQRCREFILGNDRIQRPEVERPDIEVFKMYKTKQDCKTMLKTHISHPPVTKEELNFPIAYGFTIFKGAALFERLFRAIYMPQNVHCIHIDHKSPEDFYLTIYAIIRCLPNAFIALNRIDVAWGHISLVNAQLECMKELLNSKVKWKYYISLVGQDFPLYDNQQIVIALKRLNNTNNIESFPVPNQVRTKKVFKLVDHEIQATLDDKSPPPHNITIYKGSTHIIATKGFVNFILNSKVGKDFTEFLKDTYVPDETIYSSLQQYPHAPGGIRGKQPEKITRALHWKTDSAVCDGRWVRYLCWVSIKDLRWVLGAEMRNKLFVHKIPYQFSEEILECLLVARQGRRYGENTWNISRN